MTYREILQALYSLNATRGMKLGLENPRHLDKLLGSPSLHVPAIHIAGTNGKGSVSIKIARGLQSSGKKVGLFTSPHISCFRERIRINGGMIEEKTIERLMPPLLKMKVPATFFELTTLVAFAWFREQKVDMAVLETGLGGRLDATNICKPILTVITSISLDHTHILGNTLAEIAREKGGICKKGVPCILGPRTPGLEGIRVTGNFDTTEDENRAIARAAMEELELEEDAIQEGLEARMPCRFERVRKGQTEFVLDVAHNPDGLKLLFKRIPWKRSAIVFGLSKDKDLEACVQILASGGETFFVVQPDHPRACESAFLVDKLLEAGILPEKIHSGLSIPEAVSKAGEISKKVVVCGTFFIMSQVRHYLGFDEPQDPIDLNDIKR